MLLYAARDTQESSKERCCMPLIRAATSVLYAAMSLPVYNMFECPRAIARAAACVYNIPCQTRELILYKHPRLRDRAPTRPSEIRAAGPGARAALFRGVYTSPV